MNTNHTLVRHSSDDYILAGHQISVTPRVLTNCYLHWHNYFELEVILSGNGTHILNGVRHPITKGSVYLLTPTDFHSIETDETIRLINISFTEEILTEKMLSSLISAGTSKVFQLIGDDYRRLTMAVQHLQHECDSGGPCKQQLCEYLLSTLFRGSPTPSHPSVGSSQVAGIQKAILYLELHFREPISLKLLADQAGLTPGYFSELFHQLTGESYTERLNTLRIGYAKTLLSNGLSVSEACFASGFGSLSNFLTTFKSRCGMTPSAYKKYQTP